MNNLPSTEKLMQILTCCHGACFYDAKEALKQFLETTD